MGKFLTLIIEITRIRGFSKFLIEEFLMNKAEFVDLVKTTGGFETKKDAERAVNVFTEAITKALSKKQSVELVGFGKFETAIQKAKTGKVPGTNKTYTTKEKRVPKFRPGKGLKDLVSKK